MNFRFSILIFSLQKDLRTPDAEAHMNHAIIRRVGIQKMNRVDALTKKGCVLALQIHSRVRLVKA